MNILETIAPNTVGTVGGKGKGGQTASAEPPTSGQPMPGGQPSTAINGTPLMPVMDPAQWTRVGAGNFTPGSTNKGAAMKMMGGGGGG